MMLFLLLLVRVYSQSLSSTVITRATWEGMIEDTSQDGCKPAVDFLTDISGPATCGFYFPKVNVPEDARILSATLLFAVEKYVGTIRVGLEDTSDSQPLKDFEELSQRRMTELVTVDLVLKDNNADVTKAVEAIITSGRWTPGNAMTVFLYNATAPKGTPIFTLYPNYQAHLIINYQVTSQVFRSSPGGGLATLEGDWTGFAINSLGTKLRVGTSNVMLGMSSMFDLPVTLTASGFITNNNQSFYYCDGSLGTAYVGSPGQFSCDLPCAPGRNYRLTFTYCWNVDGRPQIWNDGEVYHSMGSPRCFNETFSQLIQFPDPVLVNATLLPFDGRPYADEGYDSTSNTTTQTLNDRLEFVATVGMQHLCLRNPSPWINVSLTAPGVFSLRCVVDTRPVVIPPPFAPSDYRTLACLVPPCDPTTCPGRTDAFLKIQYGNLTLVTADSLNYPTSPVIMSVSGCKDVVGDTSTAFCNTTGGTRIDIAMAQDIGYAGVSVLVGGASCTAVYVAGNHIFCTLPPGVGVSQPVIVFSGGYISAAVYYVSYGPPTITALEGGIGCVMDNSSIGVKAEMCDRNGSAATLMTITGYNFGPATAGVALTLQDVSIQAFRDPVDPQSILYFALPPGLGANVLRMTVGLQSATATLAYEPCPLGQDAYCVACPAGRYGTQDSSVKSNTCLPCLPGSHQPRAGSSECVLCPQGSYQQASGQPGCVLCPESMTSREGSPDSNYCSACLVTQYLGIEPNTTNRVCIQCAPNSLPNGDSCGCRSGYFDDRKIIIPGDGRSLNCQPCPAGANCQETGTHSAMMGPLPGWWRSDQGTFVQCLDALNCLGVQWGYFSVNSSMCLDHRSGVLCATCDPGFQPSTIKGGACVPCDSSARDWLWASLALMLLGIGVLGAMFYLYRRKQANKRRESTRSQSSLNLARSQSSLNLPARSQSSLNLSSLERGSVPKSLRNETGVVPTKLRKKRDANTAISTCKIVVGFLQILSSMVAVNVSLPSTFMQVMRVFSFLNFDFLPWASIRCVFNIDFYTRIYVSCLYPFAIVVLLLLCVALPIALSNRRDYKDEETFREVRSQFVNQTLTLVLSCIFLLYPWVTLQLLQFGICFQIDGTYYLLADMSERCFEGEWMSHLGPVIVLFLLLSVGIPVVLGTLLYRSRGALRTEQVRQRLGFLYLAYSNHSWWFELVEMSTRVALISIVRFFDPLLHAPLRMVLCLCYIIVVLLNMPYVHESLDNLSLFCMTELMLISSLGHLLPKIGDWQGTYIDDLLSTILLMFSIVLFLYALLQLVRATRWLMYHPMLRKCRKSLPGNRLRVNSRITMLDSELTESESTMSLDAAVYEAGSSRDSVASKPSKPPKLNATENL